MNTISNTPLHDHVICSTYNRSALQSRIIHLGFGAFHRAHQALFTDEMLEKTGCDWGICEINLFGGEDLIHQLRAQDHLYTVIEKGAHSTDVKLIRSVNESLHPMLDGKSAVLEKMAEQQVAIVSMTITEKGYCADPATGRLDKNNSLIQADLENPCQPTSAIGYIVEALRIRRDRNLKPFTVMSCDNVQENGHVARAAVLDFAYLVDQDLADWIATNVTFPCTMVDRIVPAATVETLEEIAQLVGIEDPCGIACEPFRQWVIEDNFVNGRPQWNVAGAEFVADVVPFEEMKLRMLNGSHSFLAYLGYLGGYAHISDTMTNDSYRKAAFDMMMQAQAPTLTMPEGTDLQAYASLLIERFTNPSLKHQTWQIAMDGSQKIPQRMGGSLRHHLEQHTDYKWLAMGIAGWMRYVAAVDEQSNPIDVRDPMVAQFNAIYAEHGIQPSVVTALLSIEAIFGTDLIQNQSFVNTLTEAYQLIITQGARAAVASL
ncbi:fructuronate reductase [Photobacterium kishitanii]|uniref:fructuronate reductase n=1 Tax=Photobacterium kishitanii TaxID=318456 RepID=UPI0005D30471|nr:fructuronate reductase [Photobacterium kishitanii]KJG09434.1 D-mannonate oxidoreductase [Photobacterium kishitanii]PSV06463.1 fructuronate reductase [Photobacterium kishitanii]PSV77346.1 fructuronate reductase [Photobacterium kishitanii]